MNKVTTSFLFCLLLNLSLCFGQSYRQYFDGADTSKLNSIIIHLDTNHQDVWQVGSPHKHYFDSAYSRPNVIVTDTSLHYPVNDTSIFYFTLPVFISSMYAIQWVQKLDMDSLQDGGIIEFSIDTGKTWHNAFNSQWVYNFYGFQTSNKVKLPSGDTVFSGTDSVWRDIWLCFDFTTLTRPLDSLYMRYRFISGPVNQNREGWMIDNMNAHLTAIHPVKEINEDTYLKVYPRLTYGPIYILSKLNTPDFQINSAELINELGQVVQQFKIGPGDSYIDISAQANGWYTLKINTSQVTRTYSIFLNKK